MKTVNEKLAEAIDRVEILLAKGTNVLFQAPENIMVNAPVAIHQIAFQNELNGILLGLGLSSVRVKKLPVSSDQRKTILSEIKKMK